MHVPEARDPQIERPAARMFDALIADGREPDRATCADLARSAISEAAPSLPLERRDALAAELADYVVDVCAFLPTLKLSICDTLHRARGAAPSVVVVAG